MKASALIFTLFSLTCFSANRYIQTSPFGSSGNINSDSNLSGTVITKNSLSNTHLSIGMGMPILNGAAGFGVNASGMFRVMRDLPLYLGADLGFAFWSQGYYWLSGYSVYYPGGINVSAVSVLFNGRYIHNLNNSVKLLAGIALGPAFLSSNYVPSTGARAVLLFEPGMAFQITRNFLLSIEPKFGIFGSSFLFMPLFSAMFQV